MIAVVHRTTPPQAVSVVTAGGLRIRKDPKSAGTGLSGLCFQGKIFGSLLTRSHVGRPVSDMGRQRAVLVYDLESLDQTPAHISSDYFKGVFVKQRSARPQDRAGLRALFDGLERAAASRREPNVPCSEVVWQKDIPNRYLREIWVPSRATRKRMIQELKQAGIQALNDQPIHKAVKVRSKVPVIR